jgi:Zn-dependent protease
MDITIFTLIVLLFSVIIHEISHGSVAYSMGDSTAKDSGRLTLNPLKHLDPFGSVILPLLLLVLSRGQGPVFGWAKPVPVNPYNFKDQKWGMLKVSIAGPAANFLIAIIFGLAVRFIPLSQSLFIFFSIIVFYNFLLGLFNLMPIPPLDGSWILFFFLPRTWEKVRFFLTQYSIFILLAFIFFGGGILFFLAGFFYQLVSGYSLNF